MNTPPPANDAEGNPVPHQDTPRRGCAAGPRLGVGGAVQWGLAGVCVWQCRWGMRDILDVVQQEKRALGRAGRRVGVHCVSSGGHPARPVLSICSARRGFSPPPPPPPLPPPPFQTKVTIGGRNEILFYLLFFFVLFYFIGKI